MADMRTDAADIEVSGLRKLFQQTATGDQVVAIERLDFRIRSGEMVTVVGQTGCGGPVAARHCVADNRHGCQAVRVLFQAG